MEQSSDRSPTQQQHLERQHQRLHEPRSAHAAAPQKAHATRKTPDTVTTAAVTAPAPTKHNDRLIPVATQANGHVHQNGLYQHRSYPSNIEVKLEAVDRIQTQVNMNRASLESCTREMQRIDATMQRIESNIQRMQQGWGEHLEAVRVEIVAIKQQASLTNPPPGERLDDQTLEIFSANLGTIAGKANEVDALKLQIQLLNRRLRKIEEKGVMPLATQMPPPRESPVQHHNSGPPPMSSPSLSRHGYPPQSVREENRAMGQNPHPRHVIEGNDRQLMEDHHALEAEAASTGWVSVNPGSKRGHPNEPEGRTDNAESPMGSPKRPKLAPLEPRRLYEPATSQPEARDEQARPEEPPANHHTESTESYPDSTTSANFRTYEASPEVRREEPPQRAVSGPAYTATTHSPRVGRPRGRGGRPRKYLPSDVHHLSMANWEREAWAAANQNGSPDSRYYPSSAVPATPRGEAHARRGSLGGGPGRTPMSETPQSGLGDPYAHTKKTRTKPIRNSDGVLIRKDGRPDMRSQSSAANLRKVHARKEEERGRTAEGTPVSGLAVAPPLTAAPTTASNSAAHSPASLQDHDAGTDQERTERVMKHAFPHGVDEQRGRIYSRDQYMSPGTSGSPREMDGIRSSEEEEYSSRAVMKSEDVDPQRMDMSPVQKGDKAETDRRVDEAERIEISREGEASGEAVMQEA